MKIPGFVTGVLSVNLCQAAAIAFNEGNMSTPGKQPEEFVEAVVAGVFVTPSEKLKLLMQKLS